MMNKVVYIKCNRASVDCLRCSVCPRRPRITKIHFLSNPAERTPPNPTYSYHNNFAANCSISL